MNTPPLNIGWRWLAVDGIAKHIEHAGKNGFPHRRL